MFLNRHMDPEYNSGSGSGSGSVTKKRTRGLTKMGDFILVRNQGRNFLMKFNEKNQPIEKFEKKLMSYLESVVRHYVPIDILDQREVPEELKNKIWEDISVSKFKII